MTPDFEKDLAVWRLKGAVTWWARDSTVSAEMALENIRIALLECEDELVKIDLKKETAE